MLISTQALYTDKNPNGPEVGRVLPENDPDAKFTLCGAGGIIAEDIAAKFDFSGVSSVSETTIQAERQKLVDANEKTYADNAAKGGALRVFPAATPVSALGSTSTTPTGSKADDAPAKSAK